MAVLFSNNAASNLSASITSTATSLSVTAGTGAEFPNPGGSDYFYATLSNAAGDIEIIKVTARSTDTLTIVRGQDGTTARAWANSDKIELRLTAAGLGDLKADTLALVNNGLLTITAGAGLTGSGTFYANQAGNTTISLAHSDTSSQASSTNSGATVIQSIGLDGYGHLTSLTTKTIGYADVGAPSTTGTNASGTWGISISGNAATVSNGVYTNTAQTISGAKTFTGGITLGSTFTWNPSQNFSLTPTANSQEWSFDLHKGSFTGTYWQVWEDTKLTLLKVDADSGKVSAPYNFVGALEGNASSATTAAGLSNTTWARVTTSSGYIDFGPANTSYAHVYTDRPSFYLNKPLYVNAGELALSSGNYNSYAPTLTGTGASGTWGISISGNAATATKLASVGTTFTGTYPMVINASGVLYSHGSVTFNGTTGALTATSFSGSLSGNATTATTLQTARTIQGVSFNGSANITVATASTGISVSGTAISIASAYSPNTAYEIPGSVDLNTYTTAGFYYQTANADASSGSNYPEASAGSLVVQKSAGVTQQYYTYQNGGNSMWFRAQYSGVWGAWYKVLSSYNYNSYAPTLTGGGASGTWGISISGNAATATTLQTARTINGVSFNGSANITIADSTKLPLAGGTATGTINAPTFNATSTTNGGFQGIDADAATSPSFTWTADLDTGMYRENTNSIGFTAGGVLRLTVNATAVTAAGNIVANSDERLKKDWSAVGADFVERLSQVKSGTYTRTDSDQRQAGSSAQDWQKLLPEVVTESSDERKTLSLAYGNAALVSAVELAKRVVEQDAKIRRLETIIENLAG